MYDYINKNHCIQTCLHVFVYIEPFVKIYRKKEPYEKEAYFFSIAGCNHVGVGGFADVGIQKEF